MFDRRMTLWPMVHGFLIVYSNDMLKIWIKNNGRPLPKTESAGTFLFVVMLCPIRRLFVSLSRVRDVDVEERSANDVRAIQRRD